MKSDPPSEDAILAAVEHERQRIGALLHENLCQSLAGVTIQLDVMLRRLQAGKPVNEADLRLVSEHVHDAIDFTRSTIGSLGAPQVEGAAFTETLGQLTDAAGKKMSCEYICEKPVFLSDTRAVLTLLRIAEEALANAERHAHAKHTVVSLSQTPGTITLKIRDDGKGFLVDKLDGRITGIDLMRRRARSVGATLEIESAPGRGTVVSCCLPI